MLSVKLTPVISLSGYVALWVMKALILVIFKNRYECNIRPVDCFLKHGAYITHNATWRQIIRSHATSSGGFFLLFSICSSTPQHVNTR